MWIDLREDSIIGHKVLVGVHSTISVKVGPRTNHLRSDIPRVWKPGSSTLPYYFGRAPQTVVERASSTRIFLAKSLPNLGQAHIRQHNHIFNIFLILHVAGFIKKNETWVLLG